MPLPRQALAAKLTPWWCLVCGDRGGVDVVDNILLFVPLALGLRQAGWSVRATVGIGSLLSLSIELLQATVVLGRDASLSDVVTNTLGSWLGATLGTHWRTLVHPRGRAARRLALLGGTAWLATQLAVGLLLQPWIPHEELHGVWARTAYGHPKFDGRILSASLSNLALPGDSVPIAPDLPRALRDGHFELQIRLLTGQTGRWSPIVEILAGRGAVLAVEANGNDLSFQPPMRSALLRLARPSLGLPGALSGDPGTEVTVVARDRKSVLEGEWTTSGVLHRTSQALSPSLGWSLLTPFRHNYGSKTPIITVIWLAALLLPAGYWTAHVPGRPLFRCTALLLLVVTGLGLIPLLTGYRPVHWSEWLGAFAGLAVGAAGHRCTRYFETRCDSLSTRESC
jgi:hypothetical protein